MAIPSSNDLGREKSRKENLGVDESTSLSTRILIPSMSLAKGAHKGKRERFPGPAVVIVGAASVNRKRLRVKRDRVTKIGTNIFVT